MPKTYKQQVCPLKQEGKHPLFLKNLNMYALLGRVTEEQTFKGTRFAALEKLR
jgi:hypothetical protein